MPKRLLILTTALAGLTFCLCLFNGFVGDDEVMIVNNEFYRSLDNLPLLISDRYISDSRDYFLNSGTYNSSGAVSYRPVNSLSYFLDRALWDLNPSGYHLHNWLLHLANTALVFLLAWMVLRQPQAAAWAAALFGTHPVAAEAVCAISYRHDLQACFFGLAAIICYIRFRSSGRRMWQAGSLLCYGLAVFSKESAVLLPAVLVAYEWFYERQRGEKNFLKQLAPAAAYGLVTVFYLWIYLFVFPNSAVGHNPAPGNTAGAHIAYVLMLLGRYLSMWLLPLTVRPLPGLFDPAREPDLINPLSTVLFCGLLVVAIVARRRDRDFMFFTVMAAVFYLPAANLIPLANPMAHRFLYLPAAGLSVAVMILLDQVRLPRVSFDVRLFVRIGLVAAAVFTSFTVTVAWKDNLTLAHSWTRDYPRNAKGHAILGIATFRRGDCDKAVPAFLRAVQLGDRDPRLFFMLGRCAVPDDTLAAAYYRQALALAPDYAAPYRGLGQIAALRGDYEAALEDLRRSIDLQPALAAYRYAARCYIALKRPAGWPEWYRRAQTQLNPAELEVLRGDLTGTILAGPSGLSPAQ
ncbi:MAG: hypothetical protein KC897_06185 [Candidatus Omnitrophica bacterium]|nr:hypothetical protein [Candidatus Omnitrophota bacterium]MCB9721814.1 hypothetical protein [Candidatus Omnitrophota bacterium]